ncbi:MAG: glycosyltransferase [Rhodospirillales bacterium]|nr:glycosyltransferase [Rhodospirillales bacterium]
MSAQTGDARDRGVVVLTAAYNDWESARALLAGLDKEFLEVGLKARVVIVDDGSPEFADPLDFAKLELTAITDVEVVTLARNMGNQRAVAIGMGYVAANIKCDALVVMDCDLEDQPKYVPQLIAEMDASGNEIIFAERTQRSEGVAFMAFYRIYKYLYKILTGMPISIGNFSAIPGRLIRRVASISEIWSHFPAGIMRARVPFRAIPTERGQRQHGQSKMNFVSLLIHGLSGFAVHADVVGVRIVIAAFGLAAVIMFGLGVVIAKRFLFDFFVLGWTSLVVIILGIAAIQMFMAAIFMAFMILSGKNQRLIIPSIDYENYILETTHVYPPLKEET